MRGFFLRAAHGGFWVATWTPSQTWAQRGHEVGRQHSGADNNTGVWMFLGGSLMRLPEFPGFVFTCGGYSAVFYPLLWSHNAQKSTGNPNLPKSNNEQKYNGRRHVRLVEV